ncbi:hypothetical protein EIN_482610 [Entamoeba invadens IP1]|uniref:Uncharacterized protein n=1 Tax=Entamoeba invadens IP1 TaxID=370355 RepID=A0A0A1UD20_ENTIV|nr:hypothetical protein EIN_482610 [Entamoeba invadens IP1]ELP90197.1 hypothetical protein EIN_482610 [Entamoeba invadens IP1]|eukprot:XP_004256968.1 hypothetical protein EIN_482610 [Entamoeba invadens IP1]
MSIPNIFLYFMGSVYSPMYSYTNLFTNLLPGVLVYFVYLITFTPLPSYFVTLQIDWRKRWPFILCSLFIGQLLVVLGFVLYYICYPSDVSWSMDKEVLQYKIELSDNRSDSEIKFQIVYNSFLTVVGAPLTYFGMVFLCELGLRGYLLISIASHVHPAVANIITSFIQIAVYAVYDGLSINNYYSYQYIFASAFMRFSQALLLGDVMIKSGNVFAPAFVSAAFIKCSSLFSVFLSPYAYLNNILLGPTESGVLNNLPMFLLANVLNIFNNFGDVDEITKNRDAEENGYKEIRSEFNTKNDENKPLTIN